MNARLRKGRKAAGAARLMLLLSALLALAGMTASCDHREFLYENPSKRVQVTVEFDWSDDPGAMPEGMTVYFFREGSSARSAFDFKGKKGGTISIMPGRYRAICHNNDSDRHGFTGEDDFDGFGIRLNDNRNAGDLLGRNNYLRTGDERIAHSPDSMWVASLPLVEIEARDPVAPSAPQIIRFRMLPVVNRYTFIIHNPLNFNNSISVGATVSGLAGTVHPSRGATGDETVTHYFSMSPLRDGGLFGEFLTFGHCGGRPLGSRSGEENEEGTHILVIHATMSNGKRWSSTHDITAQIHGSPVPDCVIRLDSLVFPEPPGGGGVAPTVNGWTNGTNEDISM